jgi:hypothetical protein
MQQYGKEIKGIAYAPKYTILERLRAYRYFPEDTNYVRVVSFREMVFVNY